jgi:hypothetical protein
LGAGQSIPSESLSKPPGPTTGSWSNRSSRAWRAGGRGVVAAVELLVTGEGGSGEGRG